MLYTEDMVTPKLETLDAKTTISEAAEHRYAIYVARTNVQG